MADGLEAVTRGALAAPRLPMPVPTCILASTTITTSDVLSHVRGVAYRKRTADNLIREAPHRLSWGDVAQLAQRWRRVLHGVTRSAGRAPAPRPRAATRRSGTAVAGKDGVDPVHGGGGRHRAGARRCLLVQVRWTSAARVPDWCCRTSLENAARSTSARASASGCVRLPRLFCRCVSPRASQAGRTTPGASGPRGCRRSCAPLRGRRTQRCQGPPDGPRPRP